MTDAASSSIQTTISVKFFYIESFELMSKFILPVGFILRDFIANASPDMLSLKESNVIIVFQTSAFEDDCSDVDESAPFMRNDLKPIVAQ